MSTTIAITASPRQRWALALLLFHPELKFKGRTANKRLFRARRDLGLLEPSEVFLQYNRDLKAGEKILIGQGAYDTRTRHRFEVTDEVRDFLLTDVAEKLEIGAADLVWLEPILSAIEERQDSADVDIAPAYDPEADKNRWKPLLEDEEEPTPVIPREANNVSA